MTDERKISLSIPTYNRYELLINSFINVIGDERIAEIAISDDASRADIYERVRGFVSGLPKIKLYRNPENQDCYKNKMTSLLYATNDWCILFDSDNELDGSYLDKIFNIQKWEENTAYLPSFAAPHFDYRRYEGFEITSGNVSRFMHDPTFTTMLNTHNHFVNRRFYLKCWDGSINPYTSDSIYMNYQYLKNGGKLYVVPGLTYKHRVDDHQNEEGGHYGLNHTKTGNLHQEIEQKLRQLT